MVGDVYFEDRLLQSKTHAVPDTDYLLDLDFDDADDIEDYESSVKDI